MGVLLLLLLAQFDYDRQKPLAVEESPAELVEGVNFREISYESPHGGRVPAYLIAPLGRGPYAGIVFVHWGQGNRSEFISEAIVYAKAGAVSLLIDTPHMRPDFDGARDGFENPANTRDTYVQLVVDIRRGFDLLTTRNNVAVGRLGYVGHSLGATWGGAIAGVEKRARAFVLIGGLPNLVDRDTSYPTEMWQRIESNYSEEQLRAYRAFILPLSPERFVGDAEPGSVFFQFARYDRFISAGAAAAFEAAARAPHVRWYATGHEFNDLASVRDRAVWLRERLQLEPVLPLLQSIVAR